MVVFLVVGFIGCKTESDPPKAEVEKWTVVYGENSLKEGTYAELEEYAEKVGLIEITDYTVDKTNKKIILTESGMSKVTAYEGNNAGNDNNNDEENGSSTGGNTGNDNPGNTDTPETPVVTNNFKGNVFIAELSVESYSKIWGYIEFIDDTNGKMGIAEYDEFGNPIIIEQPFTYSVTGDVATLNAGEDTVTTSKLTDGIFTFSTEYEDYTVLMTCTKGDKSLFDAWTVCYGEEILDKDFFYEFEDYVEVLDVEDDYELDTANKKIVLTVNGYKKCCQPWTIVADGEDNENENYIYSMLMFNMIGLNETTDYTIDIDTLTITVTDSGMEKIQDATWTIS